MPKFLMLDWPISWDQERVTLQPGLWEHLGMSVYRVLQRYQVCEASSDRSLSFLKCSNVALEYANTGLLNEKSDIYSFGVVLLEAVTGRDPVDYGHNPPANEMIVGTKRAEEAVDLNLEVKLEIRALKPALLIALRCVDPNAEKRPKMNQVERMLEADEYSYREVFDIGSAHLCHGDFNREPADFVFLATGDEQSIEPISDIGIDRVTEIMFSDVNSDVEANPPVAKERGFASGKASAKFEQPFVVVLRHQNLP
ncbi:kinase family protein [Tripterygium wilfordii]|uniref:non-specific serine/threonine protein kinase n=1 Tax=Tripterygium wilfordii TaxID=458696 RepID=A0A7J7E1X6_TRIWF|nr:kinase family protein [Tripterygium wilfordii]